MNSTEEVRNALINFIREQVNVFYPLFCTVVSVDEVNKSCEVEPINGDANILDVKILADADPGMFMIPKVGSTVAVSMLDKDNAFVVMYSELEKILIEVGTSDAQSIEIKNGSIVFNGGNFNGLVKVSPLLQKINRLENEINKLKQIFTTWAPVPNDGGLALKTEILLQTWNTTPITPITQQSDLENTKIKHGG